MKRPVKQTELCMHVQFVMLWYALLLKANAFQERSYATVAKIVLGVTTKVVDVESAPLMDAHTCVRTGQMVGLHVAGYAHRTG